MSRIADAFQKLYSTGATTGADGPPSGTDTTASPDALVPWSIDDFTCGVPRAAAADVSSPHASSRSGVVEPVGDRQHAGLRLSRGEMVGSRGALGPELAGQRQPGVPTRDLRHYGDVLRRRWKTGAALFLVVAGGVTAGVLLMPAAYRATGLLEIRRESTGTVPVETMFSSERVWKDDLETQFGILRSTAVAQRALRLLDARSAAPKPPAPKASPAAAAAPANTTALRPEDLQKSLIVNPQPGSRLVEVSFQGPDPVGAAAVVNAVIDSYLQLRMEEAQRSADWLATQVREAQGRLDASERQLQAYVRDHGLQVLETGGGEAAKFVNERLEALSAALTQAQAERISKQSASEQAARQASARTLDSPVVQDLTVKLADLRREHAKLVSVFHEEYPSVRALTNQIAEVNAALNRELAMVVSRADREYQAALRRESLIRQALDAESARVQGLGAAGAERGGYEVLKRDVVTNQQQVATLNQKAKEVGISAALKAANVGVVDRAQPPMVPYGPPALVSITLGCMVALVLGIGGMFLREHLDTSMQSVVDVDAYLGVPALAAIPAVARGVRLLPMGAARADGAWLVGPGAHHSPLGEAFAALRTAVLLDDEGEQVRSLLITSAEAQEGKTTVSINLAASLARLDHRVLLVDANMRSPGIQRALGLPARSGLVEYLTTGADWRACRQTKVRPNLDVIPCGTPAASPADLLSLPRMRAFMTEAAHEYAYVIVDSPSLLAHQADVQSLAPLADSVLLTVRQGVTPREAVSLALSRLPRVRGVVLNRSDERHGFISQQDAAAGAA